MQVSLSGNSKSEKCVFINPESIAENRYIALCLDGTKSLTLKNREVTHPDVSNTDRIQCNQVLHDGHVR